MAGEALRQNAQQYLERGLVPTLTLSAVGAILWITTLGLAGVAATDAPSGAETNLYWAVLGTTAAAMVPLLVDFAYRAFWATPCTVALGSFAYLSSAALWSRDLSNPARLGLFAVQTAAVSIQLAAIFNQSRANRTEGRYQQASAFL